MHKLANKLVEEARWQRAINAMRLRHLGKRIAFWTAWHLPAWLVYFATIRCLANATTGKYGNQVVPELLAMDALGRWKPGGGDPRWR